MTWNILQFEYPKMKRNNWNINYQFNIRNTKNTTEVDMFYMRHMKQ